MINFASLFGNFNRGGNSAINQVLQKPDTTIQQLLDVETFPNEYKSGNGKVLDYLKYDKYQQLIKYITVEGPADDQKKGYKFPMIAADVLSSENMSLIDTLLPEGDLQIDIDYEETEEIQLEVDDNDEQYLTQDKPQEEKKEEVQEQTPKQDQPKVQGEQQPKQKVEEEQAPKPRKTKIIKQSRVVTKTRKQKRQPLMEDVLKYFEGPINYTLAGYVCKVLTTLLNKKTTTFFEYIFKENRNFMNIICNHIESKSVGDLILKMLTIQSTQFIQERCKFYDHLIKLLSEVQESHIISNLAYTIHEIVEKSSTYIKSKPNITNNKDIVDGFLTIFYRTDLIHNIVSQTLAESDTRSGYSCMVLHSYLHYTEIQTFNSFKLESILESFIEKAIDRLRKTPKKRTLGMGRVKIVDIFCFLVRKPKRTIEQEDGADNNEATSQLLEQLYIHELIAKHTDFFNILLRLLQSFENNNILHNQVFRIVQSVIIEKEQNNSALQSLLLNEECVLLKVLIEQAAKDAEIKKAGKTSCRKGYIGHIINICKLISKTEGNSLLDSRIRQNEQFNKILNTMVAADITETNKNLAGYQMKKNPSHQIMFQKQDIIAAYTDFLSNCPKPQFQVERQTSEQENNDHDQNTKDAEQMVIQEQRDQQKFNEVVAVAQDINEADPKFWINHMKYDVESLLSEIEL